jgi:hypothetical protein
MAITTTDMTLGPDKGEDEWGVIFYSADLSGCEVIKAAPGAGLCLFIDEIWFITDTAVDFDIGDGEDTSAVETKLFTTLGLDANEAFGPIKLRGQQLTANKALTIDASGAAKTNGYVIGRTGPAMTYHKDR